MSREEQIAKNELLVREANDEVEHLSGISRSTVLGIFCECGDNQCLADVPITHSDYKRIRDDRHFVVLPGHEIPDVEQVVERHESYLVVEKPASAVELAKQDPDT